MKINKRWTDSIVDNVLINVSPTEEEYNTKVSENIISWLSHAKVSYENNNKDFIKYLQYLEAKIDASRKTVTFWDTFNIRNSVETDEEFLTQYCALPNGTGLIVNKDFSIDGEKFEQGDVIYKDFYGNRQFVKAQKAGVYVPSKLEKSNNGYKLTFSFKQSTDTSKVELEGLQSPETQTGIYNEIYLLSGLSSRTLEIINGIQPIWEVRVLNSNNIYGEKIYNAVEVTINNQSITFTNKTRLQLAVFIK